MSDKGQKDTLEAHKAEMKARALKEFERNWAEKWGEFERLAMELGVELPGIVSPGDKTASDQAPLSANGFTGTVANLIDRYQTHPESRYQKLRYRTREHYDSLLRILRHEIGNERVDTFDTEWLLSAHQRWTGRGHSMAHALITQLRILATFGSTVLKDQSCRILRVTLHDMTFPTPETKRVERLTAEDAIKIRVKAHEMGFPSIALAQALQFETPLRQREVIGEWVPISEPGTPSDVIDGNMKWLRGLRWSAIDENLMLRHTTSRSERTIVFDLQKAWMVREEFARLGRDRPTTATPIIINEETGQPYQAQKFRVTWRQIADAAGIPKTVKNMDSSGGRNERAASEKEKESGR